MILEIIVPDPPEGFTYNGQYRHPLVGEHYAYLHQHQTQFVAIRSRSNHGEYADQPALILLPLTPENKHGSEVSVQS